MRLPFVPAGLATLAAAVLLACAGAVPAADAAPRRASRTPAAPAPPETLAVGDGAAGERTVRLGRATLAWRSGDARAVVEHLETLDPAADLEWIEADRAAYLLGQAYLALGAVGRFRALATPFANREGQTSWTRWLAFQLRQLDGEVTGSRGPAIDGSPYTLYWRARTLADSGGDDATEWALLSEADTASALGRDLAGAALIRRAALRLARGEDPRPLLARVPPGSRYHARARHMTGLATLERDDSTGAAMLRQLADDDTAYAARREVLLALAGRALELGDWAGAHTTYQRVDRDWTAGRDTLRRMIAANDYEPLWRAWRADAGLSGTLLLDAAAAESLAAGFADSSLDLTVRPPAALPGPAAPERAAAFRWPVPPPAPPEWHALARSARALGEARHGGQRTRWDIAREKESLADLQRYLGLGLGRARREADALAAQATLLDSLHRSLERIDAQLRAARDAATRRVLLRAATLLRGARDHLLWIGGMRVFHVEGPNRARNAAAPEGRHSPAEVLRQEEVLARALADVAERMALNAPGLIALSYEKHWRPGMIDRAIAQAAETRRSLEWARRLGATMDSSIAAAAGSDSLRRLEAQLARWTHEADSLEALHRLARDDAARRAVEGALAAMETEREAIDYGRATAAWRQSVAFGEAEGIPAAAGRDSAGVVEDDAFASPEAARWRAEAIAAVRAFLARHPGSFARGEMRFRLSDLLLIEARQAFRAAMDRYMRDPAAARAAGHSLPVLRHDEPLALYRKILDEDPGFEHRDAVLFNAAMILADEGRPEAEAFFHELVTSQPGSAYAQESWLRMGDMRFVEQRYAQSVELYRNAASGDDATLGAMALYKMGWAHFNDDSFLAAADAFRSVLDLYAAERPGSIQVELENEAEAYLVHSLTGAGGAPAFARYFDGLGSRPYETRVLMAMAQQLRRLARDREAAAADTLMIARWPRHPDALVSAQRLVETRQRGGRPAEVREARVAYAPRFAPGSDWYAAQTSDSVRSAGAAFARGAWTAAARDHHRRARETGSKDAWRQALDGYENLLERWGDDPEAASLALLAGEAAAQLGDHPGALRHYATAARAGSDSVAAQALVQRVAVTDAWYESTRVAEWPASGRRPAPSKAAGDDSLARAVIAASDDLLARFPAHPRAPEVLWRQGHLAFGHGWYDVSADRFFRLVERHPNDARAPRAAILEADALFRLEAYERSGRAYEAALAVARRAGVDSLARRAALAIPVAWYRHAEAAVAADSGAHAAHAGRFADVAARWPEYEHAHVAQYRAGLEWMKAGRPAEAVRAMETLVARFPRSEFVKDANLQIPRIWEQSGDREQSAAAYARFAARFPADSSAGDATLKAADLYSAAGRAPLADSLRLDYVRRHPSDVETVMQIMEALARRDLAGLGSRPISTLLPAPAPRPKKATVKKTTVTAPRSHLAAYLALTESHPRRAARDLVAQVRFLEGEEARAAADTVPLRQPLAAAIAARQKQLDRVLARYRACVEVGIAEWTHAATFRIGQALIRFGEALETSERPADLEGDALRAYEAVLRDRSQDFHDRGEAMWSDMLRQAGSEAADVWVTRTQESLWPRLGNRFHFRPEVEHPRIAADVPRRLRAGDETPAKPDRKTSRRDAAGLVNEGSTP